MRQRDLREYVYLNRKLVAVRDYTSGVARLYFAHTDHLGTPKALSDAAARVVWRAEHDPYGAATVDEDPDGDGLAVTLNIRFPGQYHDAETGLHYNYHRYYDPRTGQYTTSDPIGLAGGLNTYVYAYGNPVGFVDPEGLDGISMFGQASYFFINAGATYKVSIGIDNLFEDKPVGENAPTEDEKSKVCMQITTCGRAGAGASTNVTFGAEYNTGNFCEGDSASGGVWGNLGNRLVGSGSITTNGDDLKLSAAIGSGAGVAAGGQACAVKTICF